MDGRREIRLARVAGDRLVAICQRRTISEAIAKRYSDLVSEPKKLKIYKGPHALKADATRDRIAFLADELSFKPRDAKAIVLLPALNQLP